MSVIKVNKMESTGTTAGGVEIDSSGHVTVDGQQMPTTGALSNRNLIINGAMQVAQRGTQSTGVSTGAYTCADRMFNSISSLGTWTIDQSTDAPAGFTKSHKMTCTTADASPTGLDYALAPQRPRGAPDRARSRRQAYCRRRWLRPCPGRYRTGDQ